MERVALAVRSLPQQPRAELSLPFPNCRCRSHVFKTVSCTTLVFIYRIWRSLHHQKYVFAFVHRHGVRKIQPGLFASGCKCKTPKISCTEIPGMTTCYMAGCIKDKREPLCIYPLHNNPPSHCYGFYSFTSFTRGFFSLSQTNSLPTGLTRKLENCG